MDEMNEHYQFAKVDERAAGQLPQKWKNTFNISSLKLEMPPAVWESLSQGRARISRKAIARMSALGRKRLWMLCFCMTGLPPRADIIQPPRHVRLAPTAEVISFNY